MQQKSKFSRTVSKLFPGGSKEDNKKSTTSRSSTPHSPDSPDQPENQRGARSPDRATLPMPIPVHQGEKNLMMKRLAIKMCRHGIGQLKESFVGTPFGVGCLLALLYEVGDAQTKLEIEALLDPKSRIKKENLVKLVPLMLERLRAEKAYRKEFQVFFETLIEPTIQLKIRADFQKTLVPKYQVKFKPHSGPPMLAAFVQAVFRDMWEEPFSMRATKTGDFFGINGTRKECFMHRAQCRWMPYFEDYTMQAVRLDAKSTHMWIVLPKEKVKLEDFAKTFDEAGLDKLVDRQNTQRIDISLPKFETRKAIPTLRFLQKEGLTAPFSASRNRLPGMIDENLCLDGLKERVEVKVDEVGGEAQHKVELIMAPAVGPPPIPFHATRPFLYFVCLDKEPLFAGAYM